MATAFGVISAIIQWAAAFWYVIGAFALALGLGIVVHARLRSNLIRRPDPRDQREWTWRAGLGDCNLNCVPCSQGHHELCINRHCNCQID